MWYSQSETHYDCCWWFEVSHWLKDGFNIRQHVIPYIVVQHYERIVLACDRLLLYYRVSDTAHAPDNACEDLL